MTAVEASTAGESPLTGRGWRLVLACWAMLPLLACAPASAPSLAGADVAERSAVGSEKAAAPTATVTRRYDWDDLTELYIAPGEKLVGTRKLGHWQVQHAVHFINHHSTYQSITYSAPPVSSFGEFMEHLGKALIGQGVGSRVYGPARSGGRRVVGGARLEDDTMLPTRRIRTSKDCTIDRDEDGDTYECDHVDTIAITVSDEVLRSLKSKLTIIMPINNWRGTRGNTCGFNEDEPCEIRTAVPLVYISSYINAVDALIREQPYRQEFERQLAKADRKWRAYEGMRAYQRLTNEGVGALCDAADLGHPKARYHVSRQYGDGLGGFPKDRIRAVVWYRLAKRAGHSGGGRVELQEAKLTPFDEEEVQRLLSGWRPGMCVPGEAETAPSADRGPDPSTS